LHSSRLPRQQRLKTPADFQRVYKSKQWGGSKNFTFNVNVKESLSCSEGSPASSRLDTLMESCSSRTILGVTVSKKVSNKAVDRNRLKRQIKEFFRLHQHQLNSASDDLLNHQIELVITAKPNSLEASDQQRYQSLKDLWQKVLAWHRWYVHQLQNTYKDKLKE